MLYQQISSILNSWITLIFCTLLLGIVTPSYGQLAGETAPDFTLDTLLQSPNNAPKKLSALKGNVVIIEFWATWCVPCRSAMKNLDSIAHNLKNRPVRFLAISKENLNVVERFTKSHEGALWIGIDKTGEAHKRYNVDEIPHTVVIDKQGKLVATVESEEISEEKILALLEDKKVQFKPMVYAEEFLLRESTAFQKLARPKAVLKLFDARGGNEETTGRLFIPSYSHNTLQAITILPQLVSEAYQIPTKFIKISSRNLIYDRYYLAIELPSNDKQLFRDTLKTLLKQQIEISIDTTLEKEKVWVLQRKNKIEDLQFSRATLADLKHTDSSFTATKQPLKTLTKFLADKLYSKVLDFTGLNAEYDINLTFDAKEPKSLGKSLLQYGLEIVESEQPINIYVVKEKQNTSVIKQ